MRKQKQAAYAALGLKEPATREEVKKAYREKCKKFHPDLHPDGTTTKQYLLVQKAYRLIMDKKWYCVKTSDFADDIEKWIPPLAEKQVFGYRNREKSDMSRQKSKEWKEKREKIIKESEERKRKIREAQKTTHKLPSQREAEKWKKIEIEREAERIACLIKELLKLESMGDNK